MSCHTNPQISQNLCLPHICMRFRSIVWAFYLSAWPTNVHTVNRLSIMTRPIGAWGGKIPKRWWPELKACVLRTIRAVTVVLPRPHEREGGARWWHGYRLRWRPTDPENHTGTATAEFLHFFFGANFAILKTLHRILASLVRRWNGFSDSWLMIRVCGSLKQEVLIMWGTKDNIFDPALAEALRKWVTHLPAPQENFDHFISDVSRYRSRLGREIRAFESNIERCVWSVLISGTSETEHSCTWSRVAATYRR